MIWATIEHLGWDAPDLPEGCESVAYGGYGTMRDRQTMHVVRCDDRAALARLVNKQNGAPVRHSDCTGTLSIVRFGPTTQTWLCDTCGETWTDRYDDDEAMATKVPTYRRRSDAVDVADEYSYTGLF